MTWWNTKNQKMLVNGSMAVGGYHLLSLSIEQIPQIEFLTKTWIGPISLAAISGAGIIFALFFLNNKY